MQRLRLTALTFVGVTFTTSFASAQAPAPPAEPEQPAPPPTAEPAPPGDAAPETAPTAAPDADTTPAPSSPEATSPAPGVETEASVEAAPLNDSFPTDGTVAPGFPAAADPAPEPSPEPALVTIVTKSPESTVFAEDWWSHARPALEFHGAFRTRAELFHQFALGRIDTPSQAIWAQPSDNRYTAQNGNEYGPALCTASETDRGDSDDLTNLYGCQNHTQNSANLRLRLAPEIHVSDNLRIKTQIDLFDNLVLGSTPDGYAFDVGDSGNLEVQPRSGYNQLGVYDSTQVAPSASRNSFSDSILVKRAWAEYTTPLGELRFGRMPDHWGLGMLYNAGDGFDDDYQTTVDRLMVTTGLPSLDLLLAASWDFVNEGALAGSPMPGGQPYDRASIDDVNQYSLRIAHIQSLEKTALARGNLVLNGGLYFVYRRQILANDQPVPGELGGVTPDANPDTQTDAFARRDATVYVPDLWLELKYKKFRFAFEAASVLGTIESASIAPNSEESFRGAEPLKLRQFGVATQIEQKLVEDRLRLGFGFGWASGDPDAYDPSLPGDLVPGPGEVQVNDDTISTFRFHPTYRVDLILNRHLLQRVQGTYHFRPSVEYDFIRDPDGQRAGGGVQAIWTRASEFVQTPGHDADLGLELNATLFFQAKDGVLNDTPDTMGGFYSALQYGVLFPLDGMGYQSREQRELPRNVDAPKTAQTLRLFLGVKF